MTIDDSEVMVLVGGVCYLETKQFNVQKRNAPFNRPAKTCIGGTNPISNKDTIP